MSEHKPNLWWNPVSKNIENYWYAENTAGYKWRWFLLRGDVLDMGAVENFKDAVEVAHVDVWPDLWLAFTQEPVFSTTETLWKPKGAWYRLVARHRDLDGIQNVLNEINADRDTLVKYAAPWAGSDAYNADPGVAGEVD